MKKLTLVLAFLASGFLYPGYQIYSQNYIQLGMDIDGEAPGDESGLRISMSSDGNIVAIGAAKNDGNRSNSGHVRVYFGMGVVGCSAALI